MTFNIIPFDDCNSIRILTNKADNTLVMRDKKIFCAPFTDEYLSFVIDFSFLSCRQLLALKSTQKYYLHETSKIEFDAVEYCQLQSLI